VLLASDFEDQTEAATASPIVVGEFAPAVHLLVQRAYQSVVGLALNRLLSPVGVASCAAVAAASDGPADKIPGGGGGCRYCRDRSEEEGKCSGNNGELHFGGCCCWDGLEGAGAKLWEDGP